MGTSMMEHLFCSVQDFEDYALKTLPKKVADYYSGGSYEQSTLKNNKEAFRKLKIKPKMLVDATFIDTSAIILGTKINFPIGVAPSAMQRMAHPDGECANVRAAGSMGTVYILSTLATTSIEDVAAAAPDAIKWFQLYIYKDRKITENLVRRAEKSGFKALVLTVDANVFADRYSDMRNQFQLPTHLTLANFENKSCSSLDRSSGSGLTAYSAKLFDPSISWKDVSWLKSITKMPLVLKGILTVDDAIKAVNTGVDALIISNHGGRQLDTSPAAIEALPEISKAVGDKIEIYLDGGVRLGSDVFKAIALGAKMVFVGRPALWGLAYNGEEGARKVLKIISDEFKKTLGLTGCNSLSDIKRNMVVHESYYHKL